MTNSLKFVQVPISVGELLNKITLSEIHLEKTSDPERRCSLNEELASLRSFSKTLRINSDILLMIEELKASNIAILNAENVLQECERRKEFGEAFIASARVIYKNKDHRSNIKKILDMTLQSAIIEETQY